MPGYSTKELQKKSYSVDFFPVKVKCICGGEFEMKKAPIADKKGKKKHPLCPKCKALFDVSMSPNKLCIIYAHGDEVKKAMDYGKDDTESKSS